MRRTLCLALYFAAVAVVIAAPPAHRSLGEGVGDVRMIEVSGEGAKYWPRWRGPSGQGLVAAGAYTDTWSPNVNVWTTSVPGRGNSSPIVWGDRIFLTTAYGNGNRLSMLAYSRADGKKLWETFIPQSGVEYAHYKNGFASATPVTDGQLVYASFGRHGLVAFDFNGKIAWQHKFGIIDNYHGPAGSPVLYKDRIFIFQDANPAPGQTAFVGAFDKATGKPIWQTPRRESIGWGTAVVINTGERDEVIVSSQYRVAAYDPDSGRELWTVRGNTEEVIPTPVVGHGLVFASSGRAGPTIAIKPGGSGDVTSTHVAWSSPRGSPFVPSGIVVGDLLYLINDMQSILTVYEAATGKLVYQNRLGTAFREGFSASPVHVNGKIFLTNDDGQTFVVEAGRTFKLLRVNELGEQTLASPALVEGTWYWRTASTLRAIR
ncbi:MAG TPA: PQQ-binding-like beta-propeller repeat protein [Vicinamibacterales bacterium]|nr:PQQ-binding-like beta-propeller repeat protein [Vicinamibacterales bacterium]